MKQSITVKETKQQNKIAEGVKTLLSKFKVKPVKFEFIKVLKKLLIPMLSIII